MNARDRKYYDAVMAAYAKGEGRLSFQDRTALSKDRVALGIAASDAMAIEESAKTDYRRNAEERERRQIEKQKLEAEKRMKEAEERLQAESARMAAEQKRTAEALEQRRREEAKAKAEAEERERKRREEREATERAEAEARRLKAEREAREDAERLERQEQERREKQEHEEAVRRVRERWSALLSFVVGILPIISAGMWLLRDYALDLVRAYIVGGCAVFSVIMYVCRFRNLYWKCRWAYVLYGALMMLAVFAWPPIKDMVCLPESCLFLTSPRLPFWISVVSVALLSYQTGWFGEGLIKVGGLIVSGICTAVLLLTGHWGVGVLMGLIVGTIGSQMKERSVYSASWRWIGLAIGMLISAAFGCKGHWIVSSIAMFLAACFVVKTDS